MYTVSPHRNDYSLLEDPASKFYKYNVNEKVDHITSSVILNKITIQSMNHNIHV